MDEGCQQQEHEHHHGGLDDDDDGCQVYQIKLNISFYNCYIATFQL